MPTSLPPIAALSPDTPWHSTSTTDTLALLQTGKDGLNTAETTQRLAAYGYNSLPAPSRPGTIRRLLAQFHNILIYVLLAAAAITYSLGHTIDTAVILAVVCINSLIGFIQEGRAEHAITALRTLLAPTASVIRDGKRQIVASETLVIGDIVVLEAGDKVPADIRLLEAHTLSIQEALLTGESLPVVKNAHAAAANASIGDRHSMAFSGTMVNAGQARGVVVATGSQTEIGRIGTLMAATTTLTTPLVKQMAIFAKWLTLCILLVSTLLLIYGLTTAQYPFNTLFLAVVGLLVSAIPEGLPAVLTITLAIGVQKMARHHAIIRQLPAIETIGAVSVICTDKTGTLTRNEMLATTICTTIANYTISGEGYTPEGTITSPGNTASCDAALSLCAHAALLCNDASLRYTEEYGWQVAGDPMEGALLAFAAKAQPDSSTIQATWPRLHAIPFDARHRFMATLHPYNQQKIIFIKGAPEALLRLCQQQYTAAGTSTPIQPEQWLQQANTLAAQGQRVLAFAMKIMPVDCEAIDRKQLETGSIFLGIIGLIDPPRSEAIAAISTCQRAGIDVKMITGDHAQTATAIAAQLGITANTVITGADLDAMDDATLRNEVLSCSVFARTSPEHKLRLITALQSHNLIVAMTGDGVNDTPALKRADAGIAMGKKGSDAAKEAADLVLADDNFASIVAAVREGRTVYDNIKKVISWTLPTNGGESMTIVVALLLGIALPISPTQILWVNMLTAITLGLALAFEPTEANTMYRQPRQRNEPVLSQTLLWHIVLVSGLFLAGIFGVHTYALQQGYSEDLARTMAVNTLVVMKIFHLFFIRNIYSTSLSWRMVRGTPVIWFCIIATIMAQMIFTYYPPVQRIFATEAVALTDGLLIIVVGMMSFVLLELEKQHRLRRNPVSDTAL